jgi:formylmethanofuran dehydrogenase subunit C
MAGGTLTIEGNVDDFAASTLPGSMDGMRGGQLVVKGNAGARFGDRMRRGTAMVFGDAGDFLASRMVAGTIAVGGRVGAHEGYGMRRRRRLRHPSRCRRLRLRAALARRMFSAAAGPRPGGRGAPFAGWPHGRVRYLGDLGAAARAN